MRRVTERIVDVVYCIDTEGPLHEPLTATFERLKQLFNIDLPADAGVLKELQDQRRDLGGLEAQVARVVAPHVLSYNDTWEKIDAMLAEVLSPAFRRKRLDSFGGGLIYNWHCVDHVDYTANPRRRDLGYNHVFDHYAALLRATGSTQDRIEFHYHPLPFSGAANHSGTHWLAHGDTLYQSLARRIIDKQWFPSVNRAGFHVERADSHWFLEQFIPFDYSNQAHEDYAANPASSNHRFGDWSRAPQSWVPYHPAHDDYQAVGDCRRWVFRCLNVGTRLRLLTQAHVDQAFAEARDGKPAVLAFTNHDFRDVRPDIAHVSEMLDVAAKAYPEVQFRFSDAASAARRAAGLTENTPLRFEARVAGNVLDVEADSATFGPQPFFALRTRDGKYHADNLDIVQPFRRWQYTFDEHTFALDAVDSIGLGACGKAGHTTTAVWRAGAGAFVQTYR